MTDWWETWGYDAARRAACVAAFGDWHSEQLWKHNDDLRRYDKIIRDTRPDVIIETGTNTGASASWFVSAGPDLHVCTIDTEPSRFNRASDRRIYRIAGSSTDPGVVAQVRQWLGRPSTRVMVTLDSDHSADHVRREIELYAPMVTPGCYLVIEDGILAWLDEAQLKAHNCQYDGTPLDAIERAISDGALSHFTNDAELEFAYPVTMSPAGWWRRDG